MPLKVVSPCKLMVSTGLTPLSSRMGSARPSRLQSRAGNVSTPADNKAEHLLTWDGGEASAHSSVVSTLLLLRATPMCMAPSGPMLMS
eukprot:scaffold3542_cov113-Isochrysis_galbana.AAC.1